METILRKSVILKTIEEEILTYVYIDKNGTVFDDEAECLKSEEEIDFNEYFKSQYLLEYIDPMEYGLNLGHTTFCHLVYVGKINDKVIDDFINFYKLVDYPGDLIKIKQGWSIIALVNDVSLWVFGNTDRLFIVQQIEDILKRKNEEINLLGLLIKKKENEKNRRVEK